MTLMQPGAAYLETQVKTAPPQKLRLMLIEGALRFAHKTMHDWKGEQDEAAADSLRRCRAIVAELLAGASPTGDAAELSKQVAGVYVILFRTLTEAQAQRSPQKMQDVIRVLDIERDTWRMVCDQSAEGQVLADKSALEPAPLATPTVRRPGFAPQRASSAGGINLQG